MANIKHNIWHKFCYNSGDLKENNKKYNTVPGKNICILAAATYVWREKHDITKVISKHFFVHKDLWILK